VCHSSKNTFIFCLLLNLKFLILHELEFMYFDIFYNNNLRQ
jgi:hypothetical protein